MKTGDKTFIKVTQTDVYNEIKGLRQDFLGYKELNAREHKRFFELHDKNKSKLAVLRWIAGSALAIGCFTITSLITYLLSH